MCALRSWPNARATPNDVASRMTKKAHTVTRQSQGGRSLYTCFYLPLSASTCIYLLPVVPGHLRPITSLSEAFFRFLEASF